MANRLLDRQVSLLQYLTSSAAIFGDERDAPLDPSLHGIDHNMLRLEARFSYEKRMEKIVAAFPKTFGLLGSEQVQIVRDFVETCPPEDITRLVNARQFHEFLSARWQRERPAPPYLRDVAACELACAEVRIEESGSEETNGQKKSVRRNRMRRRPGVVLLRCAYDIRPIFEGSAGKSVPTKRDTPIVVAMPPGADQPRVFELLPVVFDLLAVLDDWTDPAELSAAPELKEIIDELVENRLIEVRR